MLTKRIESLQHPLIKHLVKLRENRRYRQENDRLLISGKKMVKEVGEKQIFPTLIFTSTTPPPFSASLYVSTTIEVMKKITGLEEPEEVAAEVTYPHLPFPKNPSYLLLLDHIADPGNLGTIIRSALALGFEGAILTENSTDPFNDKALRSAKGASFFLPLLQENIENVVPKLREQKFSFYVADTHGEAVKDLSFSLPLVLILGNESHGPSSSLSSVGKKISIPMHNNTDSLNVAISGAILMYLMKEKL